MSLNFRLGSTEAEEEVSPGEVTSENKTIDEHTDKNTNQYKYKYKYKPTQIQIQTNKNKNKTLTSTNNLGITCGGDGGGDKAVVERAHQIQNTIHIDWCDPQQWWFKAGNKKDKTIDANTNTNTNNVRVT